MKKKLSPRSMFAKCSALLSLMAVMPLSAWAQSVTTVTTTENLISNSTVYAGEVVVDGVSEIKYLYSGEITIQSVVIQNLLDLIKNYCSVIVTVIICFFLRRLFLRKAGRLFNKAIQVIKCFLFRGSVFYHPY